MAPRATQFNANPELWDRFWTLLASRGGNKSLTLIKIKSDLSGLEKQCGVAYFRHIAANEAADQLATIAAHTAEPSTDDVGRIAQLDKERGRSSGGS